MYDFGLLPEPPLWALEAGLPHPHEGETFIPYVRRLGLRPAPLLIELTQRTIVLANARLATTLSKTMRASFDRHVEKIANQHMTPERRRQIQIMAFNLFGDHYRWPCPESVRLSE